MAEILVATGRVKDLILSPEETGKITEAIAEGSYYGMQHLRPVPARLRHRRQDQPRRWRYEYATSPHDFKLMLAAGGQRASGIEQLAAGPGGAEPGPAVPQGVAG